MSAARKQVIFAALAGLGLRLFLILHFPAESDDTRVYDELARNWLDHRVYGLFVNGHLMPADLRAPGYPAFLAAIYVLFGRTHLAVRLVQAVLDLVTCFLTAALAARLAPQRQRQRVTRAALWLAATCPFLANYAAVPLTEVLAAFLTATALFVFVTPWRPVDGPPRDPLVVVQARQWFLGGALVGLGALVRPEAPPVLVAVALVLSWRWRRPADWRNLLRAGALMAAGFVLPLLPWGARNWSTLHEVQFLAPRYSQMRGEYVPRGFNAWTRTWLVRFRDVYLSTWKLEKEPLEFDELPASAFDTSDERARVAALLDQYNDALSVTPEWDRAFAELARERTARHPLRTYLWVPLGRAATLWFTPRVELLPYSGHVWPLRGKWREDPMDVSVTGGFFLLNCFYVGLALWGARRAAIGARSSEQGHEPRGLALALLCTFLIVRTIFFTQIETPEPRYVLVCFPALLALAAQATQRPVGLPNRR